MRDIYVTTTDKTYDLSNLKMSIAWSGERLQAARRLEVRLPLTADQGIDKIKVPTGSLVEFSEDKEELFEGYVFNMSGATPVGERTIMAYDQLIYLKQNEINLFCDGSLTVTERIKNICKDLDVDKSICAISYKIKKQYQGQAPYEIIADMLAESTKQTGDRYWIVSKGGKLYVRDEAPKSKYRLERGINLISADYEETIEDMRNQIIVYGENGVVGIARDEEAIKKYGLMSHVEDAGANAKTEPEAKALAKTILKMRGKVAKKATIEALGVNDVITGNAVVVKNPLLGLSGTYYVESDEHTWENNVHRMRLDLVFESEDLAI